MERCDRVFLQTTKERSALRWAAFYASLGYTKLGTTVARLLRWFPSLRIAAIGVTTMPVQLPSSCSRQQERRRTQSFAGPGHFVSFACCRITGRSDGAFQLRYALFLSGKFDEAAEQLRPVITTDQRDGYAYFLFSKSLAKTGKTEAATAADNQARRWMQSACEVGNGMGEVPKHQWSGIAIARSA